MTPLVEVQHLTKRFVRSRRWLTSPATVTAVDDVSFEIRAGETFGLVGESGSGKTTTGRCVLRLVEPTSGQVRFAGQDVLSLPPDRLRAARRQMQIVFQDPYSSLDPRIAVGTSVEEPLAIHGIGSTAERRQRVIELFEMVGLDPSTAHRLPREFSGGQRQRLALARALALNPSFIVADEPVSSLDVSVQAQVMNLLLDLQERLSLTYLLIAHDLRLVEQVCDRVAVMYRGRIVEMGPTAAVFAGPRHLYTQALLSAVPTLNRALRVERIRFDEDAIDKGATLEEVAPGHWVAAHTGV